MHKQLAPENLRTNPNYSQGIETAPGMRIVAVAGQTGAKKDGSVPDGIAAVIATIFSSFAASFTRLSANTFV